MQLADVYESVRGSIVALGTRVFAEDPGQPPVFPQIVGSGFIADSRGVVVTNKHVALRLMKYPKRVRDGQTCVFAMMPTPITFLNGLRAMGLLFIDVIGYGIPAGVEASDGPYYGEPVPDFAFLHVRVKGAPALKMATDENVIRAGVPVACAGFPMGKIPLVDGGRVVQLMPFLRTGIISSVLPFPAPQPHGFTLDIMSQGGSSGSAIFLPDTGEVMGVLYGGFGQTNVTCAVPAAMVHEGMKTWLGQCNWDFEPSPAYEKYVADAPGTQLEFAKVSVDELRQLQVAGLV